MRGNKVADGEGGLSESEEGGGLVSSIEREALSGLAAEEVL